MTDSNLIPIVLFVNSIVLLKKREQVDASTQDADFRRKIFSRALSRAGPAAPTPLDGAGRCGPSAAMTVETHLLRCLRRSLLGVWLAVAYALAVLASALSPSPASAHGLLDGARLCSGLTPPGQDAPEPTGEPQHCKGCPVSPVSTGPGPLQPLVVARVSAAAVAGAIRTAADAPAPKPGLPPSHAPPGAGPRHL